ncbi:hypothetical protein P175DRAFT_0497234 [Aspergillus ochraceoroseus IBT 24754]|uniref:Uncharacterized protein n=1 Tax=Aspergillus ochraceoroseus IBT 24754 TaxID=1392256 RepID=A0A2T5M6F3_9EURO|nr:uncharacterized protein P175DRAFT_0497234 [Aspergillus ochraceoroseus IBT 24754]PTU24113.1 hypothetical protein P175DRAFT_0497234 [Aspergillus ochraceoroseus IBT 24754]
MGYGDTRFIRTLMGFNNEQQISLRPDEYALSWRWEQVGLLLEETVITRYAQTTQRLHVYQKT